MNEIQESVPRTFVVEDRAEAELSIASEIAELLRAREAAVLGLATGSTPVGVYRELIRRHRDEALSFARASTFNLDEYIDLESDHPASFTSWMREQLFAHVDLAPQRARLPVVHSHDDPARVAADYELAIRAAGGLDLQLLGIGRNGHIGFNEPGSTRASRTRIVDLHPVTRADAAAAFGGLARVPLRAITMGIATILEARTVRVLAFGARKADIVRATLLGPEGAEVPATYLREHPNARLYVDREAASAVLSARSGHS